MNSSGMAGGSCKSNIPAAAAAGAVASAAARGRDVTAPVRRRPLASVTVNSRSGALRRVNSGRAIALNVSIDAANG